MEAISALHPPVAIKFDFQYIGERNDCSLYRLNAAVKVANQEETHRVTIEEETGGLWNFKIVDNETTELRLKSILDPIFETLDNIAKKDASSNSLKDYIG